MAHALSRPLTFGPALALPLWGWIDLGKPFHWAGLGLMTAAGLLVVPALVLVLVVFLPAAMAGLLVPRRWRIRYRQKHGRDGARSAYISKRLRRAVYAADRYRCVYCKSRTGLQVDHGRPWAAGGQTTLFNCFTLCGTDNRIKSDYWRDRDGYVHYRGFPGSENAAMAAAILRAERRHRWNPFRLLRAAWALG